MEDMTEDINVCTDWLRGEEVVDDKGGAMQGLGISADELASLDEGVRVHIFNDKSSVLADWRQCGACVTRRAADLQ